MKNSGKKGFTIVELVIVIAVIAILAAVLIPTFSGIVTKAKYSKDVQNCRNMNTTLTTSRYLNGDIANVNDAKDCLKAGGFSEKSFTPASDGYYYWWYQYNNTVYLIKDDGSSESVDYPDEPLQAKPRYRLDKEYYTITVTSDNLIADDNNVTAVATDATEGTLKFTFTGTTTKEMFNVEVTNANATAFLNDDSNNTYYSDGNTISIFQSNLSDPNTTINLTLTDFYNNITISTSFDCCFAAGTPITMADGSVKAIEDIIVGDEVLTFNHFSGQLEAQAVYLNFKGEGQDPSFELFFDDGTSVCLVHEHNLFEQESCKYVSVKRENAEDFIGKHFYSANAGGFVELVDVVYHTEPVDYYTLYTEYNTNYIAGGMLNVSEDMGIWMEIFKFNEDLTIDQAQLAEDIAEFGLLEYSEDVSNSLHTFESQNHKYANIVVGKGLATWEELYGGLDEYLNSK